MELQSKLDIENLENEDSIRYLTFLTDSQLFGIPIIEVVQIVGIQEITRLPEQPEYSKGIISLRGHIIPVIDMRLRFGKPEKAYNDRTCIIIISVQDGDYGLIVDEVDEVIEILPEQVVPVPKSTTEKATTFLTGIAQLKSTNVEKERIVLLLDAGKLLSEEQFEMLAQVAQK